MINATVEQLLDTLLDEGGENEETSPGSFDRYCDARRAIHDYVSSLNEQIVILHEQLAECAADALRWRIVNRHATWMRRNMDSSADPLSVEVGTFLEIRVANNADLSCSAMRAAAVDALDKETI